MATDPSALASYPPPYALTGDFAVFWLLTERAALGQLSAAPVLGLFGKTALAVVLARYSEVRFGLQQQRWRPDIVGDAYREVSLVQLSSAVPPFALGFPRLWVDAPEDTPIALGTAYGFPKAPGAIRWNEDGTAVTVAADDERGDVLRVRAKRGLRVPARVLSRLVRGRALFPETGLQAPVSLGGAQRAQLLTIEEWRAPRLNRWGIRGRPWLGLWLQAAELRLGPPERSRQP